MREGQVLILTEPSTDPHAMVVKKALERIGESVLVVDPGSIPPKGFVVYELSGTTTERTIVLNDQVINLDNIKSCWYRRPSKILPITSMHKDYQEIVQTEWKVIIGAIWESMHSCFWVSRPSAIHRAEFKSLQLSVARGLGLRIPRTIFTNDSDKAYDFYLECGRRIIGKKIYSHGITHQDSNALFTSHLIEDFSPKGFENLELCPCIFQEYIPKTSDIRVTVIGKEVHAVQIDSQQNEYSKIDYRADQEAFMKLKHTPYNLPIDVQDNCRKLVRNMGLEFGAIDLVKESNGSYVFLELNPNGQWLWIELLTGLPMAASMATLLALKKE
jgi:glutathione synthase/RimK-type ligase-like ATP-grasp enzyme